MTSQKGVLAVLLILGIKGAGAAPAAVVEKAPPNTVPAHMVVTVQPLKDGDDTTPVLSREDVMVRQGKSRVAVTGWIPGRDQAGLQLFILIDETSNPILGLQFDDVRAFIQAQAATTWIALGYMRNTSVNIVQNFTTDHAQVAKALRLPLGTVGASDSPYLSLIGLMKGWRDDGKMRREVLMIGDGIDRLRGPTSRAARWSSRAAVRDMPYISPDVDVASQDAQRYGIIIHSIYTTGVGHASRNYYEANSGQNGLAKLADETGGESFFLGLQNNVSFKPYLDRLQSILDNQYFLMFQAKPGKQAGLQRVNIGTEVPRVEIVSADSVWVAAEKGSGKQK